ncbi:MAG: aminotransferase class I/II-fold pyridoxal phosphate-dependent enzyme [Clostridia bacterium]|nr:aminotransferase class I/II-fold pyridoxal phosphate-dependent enzyme [Clostridia bacterium]
MSLSSKSSQDELNKAHEELVSQYNRLKSCKLNLDMSRGKPAAAQLDLSNGILTLHLDSYINCEGNDVRNYGILTGIKECRHLFSELLGIKEDNIIIGGNSSLNLIYDAIARYYMFGKLGSTPWSKLDKVKFLCPVPGYDRHFSICQEFGFEMINIPMDENGPDMDMVEKLVKEDDSIKGMLCVPLYSNPGGICYSDEVVERIASMKTAAEDFTVIWDNAYGIHHVYNEVKLANIFDLASKYGTEDRILYFFSTSKITFPGSGVALIASGDKAIEEIKRRFGIMTIGYNKINQLRTYSFFKTPEGMMEHMKKLGTMLREKFDVVLNKLDSEFKDSDLLKWNRPDGGYFISVYTLPGCAKETVRLAKECGLILTDAGAAYPYGNDPYDSNIRIAPSYPPVEDLKKAMELFCICVKLAAVKKLMK